MNAGLGWAVALLVADVVLVLATGLAFRRCAGRTLPYALAVLAGVVLVLLVAAVVAAVALA